MRVLMVTGAIPDAHASSGASVVMAGQLAAIASRHTVTLVTYSPATRAHQAALAAWRAAGVTVHATSERMPLPLVRAKRRVQGVAARWIGSGPRRESLAGDARTQAIIDGLLAREPFDIVQAESVGVGNFRYPLSVRAVLTEHEVGRFASATSEAWRADQPAIWARFDRVQVFTALDADRFRAAAPVLADRVRVNPFGIDMPELAEDSREVPGTISFVGSFNHAPNLDALLWFAHDILPLVAARHPAARLEVIGEDPPAAVRRLAGPRITVAGRVPDVAPHLRRAAVVVAPMRTGGGMRRKVLEAMAFGKALVSTSLGAEGLGVSIADLPLAIADTTAEFGEHVTRLLADTSARRALGLRARAHVAAHHTWAAHVDRLDAIYGELVSR